MMHNDICPTVHFYNANSFEEIQKDTNGIIKLYAWQIKNSGYNLPYHDDHMMTIPFCVYGILTEFIIEWPNGRMRYIIHIIDAKRSLGDIRIIVEVHQDRQKWHTQIAWNMYSSYVIKPSFSLENVNFGINY